MKSKKLNKVLPLLAAVLVANAGFFILMNLIKLGDAQRFIAEKTIFDLEFIVEDLDDSLDGLANSQDLVQNRVLSQDGLLKLCRVYNFERLSFGYLTNDKISLTESNPSNTPDNKTFLYQELKSQGTKVYTSGDKIKVLYPFHEDNDGYAQEFAYAELSLYNPTHYHAPLAFAAISLALSVCMVLFWRRFNTLAVIIMFALEFLVIATWIVSNRVSFEALAESNGRRTLALAHARELKAKLKGFEAGLAKLDRLASHFTPANQDQFSKLAAPFVSHQAIRAIEWVEPRAYSDKFWQKNSDGGRSKVNSAKSMYYPIIYAEPLSENLGALNYDLSSEDTRNRALQIALSTGRMSISDTVYLVQENTRVPAFLTFCPIYGQDKKIRGIVVGVIDAKELFGVGDPDLSGDGVRFQKASIDQANPKKTNEEVYSFASSLYGELFEVKVPIAYASLHGYRPEFSSSIPTIYIIYLTVTACFILLFTIIRQRKVQLEKEIEKQTAESQKNESHFNRLFDSSPIAYLVLEGDTIVFSNNKAHAMFQAGDLKGRSFLDFASPVQSDGTPSRALYEYHSQIAKIKGSSNFEWNLVGKDANLRWMEGTLAPFENYMLASLHDISNRKELEIALVRSTERFSIASEAARIGVWEWEIDRNTFFCDERLYRIFGIFNQAEIKTFADFADLMHPNDRAHVQRAFTLALTKRQDLTVDCSLLRGGKLAYFRLFGKLSRDSNAKNQRIVGIALEITAQRQIEIDLRETIEKANAATRAKSEFLANMSHEIRTPLNGILGVTDLLEHTNLDDEQRRFAKTIANSGTILLELINDILDLSKIEAGRLELEKADFDLPHLLIETLRVLSVKAEEKGVELIYEALPKHATMVKGDKNRIRQIVTNLVGNAIKFTARGHVKLSYSLLELGRQGAKVQLAVSDTGIGIPSNKLDHIFEKFTQVDASTTRKFGGTGLGLSICKELTQKMGGSLRVESVLGEGSHFYAVIEVEALAFDQDSELGNLKAMNFFGTSPALFDALKPYLSHQGLGLKRDEDFALDDIVKSQDTVLVLDAGLGLSEIEAIKKRRPDLFEPGRVGLIAAQTMLADENTLRDLGITKYLIKPFDPRDLIGLFGQKDSVTSVHEVRDSEDYDTKEFKALLVEDNVTNQLVAKALLQRIHGIVTIANNGQEALDHLETEAFDVVFMDVQMPVLDGFEATRQFHSEPRRFKKPRTPIIAMTAHALSTDREQCLNAGMDDYISKPIHIGELAQLVKKWVGGPVPLGVVANPTEVPQITDGFDAKGLRGRVLGQLEFAIELIGQFNAQTERLLTEFEAAHKIEDFDAIKNLAHKLKGAALTMGGVSLGAIANEIEKAAVYHNAWDIAALEKNMLIELTKLQENLREFVSDWKAKGP